MYGLVKNAVQGKAKIVPDFHDAELQAKEIYLSKINRFYGTRLRICGVLKYVVGRGARGHALSNDLTPRYIGSYFQLRDLSLAIFPTSPNYVNEKGLRCYGLF
jgi:hypothetical protein